MLDVFTSRPSTLPRIESYSTDDMRGFVEALSFPRPYGTPGNERARTLIANKFFDMFGKPPTLVGDTKNIVMGDVKNAEILVGAHYDSVPGTPGADDNASAVAVMFYIAARIHPRDNVCFVAFNGEECGLIGARDFIANLPVDTAIKQVHVLEMVGYYDARPNTQRNPFGNLIPNIPTTGDFIGVVTNSNQMAENIELRAGAIDVPVVGINLQYGEHIERMAPHLLRSDHTPFWERGIAAAMWTDTAEFRNPNYHQDSDKPDTLDYDFMADVGDVILEIIKGER
jgi:Zn-dependent M28 family amino/carboxypeptidase